MIRMLPINLFSDELFRFPDLSRGFNPDMKTDIKEVDGNIEMQIDFPGFAKEDISITIEDGYLNVEGVRNVNKDEKDKDGNYIRKERFSGRTARSYYVGDVSEEDVKASFENGVLKVVFPKEKESLPEAKKILIE